jgi:putative DNA primase/helicase
MVKIGGTNNADPDLLPLGMYDEAEGIYVTSEDSIRAVAREYLPSITDREFKEAMKAVRDTVPVRQRSMHPDLIAVNNGIFDFSSKELRPFDPEMIFISKSRVAYDANAESPRITMPDGQVWEFDAWLLDLMDDDEDMAELIREILSAILRPHVSWDKSAWFYSTKGNNGKGTLVALMRELLGAQSYASIPLADFGKEFVLEPLMRAQAILVDENDVGVFIDKAANLKAVQTNDSIFINRKHKIPVTYQFYGFMVQCINEQPMVKDKSESFYRRQLFVPFTKSFTGAERRYIKHDYLKRPEVLQYVLKLALHMEHYALSEPKPVVEAMEAYKLHNDPVRSFWKEFEPRLQWDLLPSTFLYALFKAWFERSNPKGSVISRNSFLDRLREVALPQGRWEWTDNTRSKGRMEDPEELIVEYNLVDWMSRTYTGNDPTKRSLPLLNPGYAGLKLVGTKLTLVQDDEDDVA